MSLTEELLADFEDDQEATDERGDAGAPTGRTADTRAGLAAAVGADGHGGVRTAEKADSGAATGVGRAKDGEARTMEGEADDEDGREVMDSDEGEDEGADASSGDRHAGGSAAHGPGAGAASADAPATARSASDEAIAAGVAAGQPVTAVARLTQSALFLDVMAGIERNEANPERTHLSGPAEYDPEYKLMVQANNLTAAIGDEIAVVHRYVRDVYAKRFPELETHVLSPLEYLSTVRLIGNNMEVARLNLGAILPAATVMVINVVASTTKGRPLTEDELSRVMEACELASKLDAARTRITNYVASRMALFAPNVTAIVGAATAAKLMSISGGIAALSKMPACNVQLLGAQRRTLSGFGASAVLPHTGTIYYCDFVQSVPPEYRRKAARLIATKVALAARIDSCHEQRDGAAGRRFREDIISKLEKAQEPPPPKLAKPLPVPLDMPSKKRAGRRVRRNKERFAVTELRRQANRVKFGEVADDVDQTDLGYSLGQLQQGTGNVRAIAVDNRSRVSISKRLQREMAKQRALAGGLRTAGVSGTASVAFTTVQGLEIINPAAAEKKSHEPESYFGDSVRFAKPLPIHRPRP